MTDNPTCEDCPHDLFVEHNPDGCVSCDCLTRVLVFREAPDDDLDWWH